MVEIAQSVIEKYLSNLTRSLQEEVSVGVILCDLLGDILKTA